MSELPLYRISGWNEHFENYKSRSLKRCGYVCTPNKHGGSGWTGLLMSAPEPWGHAFYTVFQFMVQFCSRQLPPRDGWLTVDGKKDGARISAAELGRMFRCSPSLVRRTLAAARAVGWMELIDGQPETRDGNPDATAIPDSIPQSDTGSIPQSDAPAIPDSIPQSGANGILGSDDERKKERRNEPLSSPKGIETNGNGHFSIADAQAWINSLFGRQAQWSYEETRLLSELDATCLSKPNRALISWVYKLPRDSEGWVLINGRRSSKRKENILTLLRDFSSEIDKWQGWRRPTAATKPAEPLSPEWIGALKKLFGDGVPIPGSKALLAPSVVADVELLLKTEAA